MVNKNGKGNLSFTLLPFLTPPFTHLLSTGLIRLCESFIVGMFIFFFGGGGGSFLNLVLPSAVAQLFYRYKFL